MEQYRQNTAGSEDTVDTMMDIPDITEVAERGNRIARKKDV